MKETQFVDPPPPPDNDGVIGSNQCLCLPKAELKTKNSRLSFWFSTRFTRKKLDHSSGIYLYL